VDGELALGTQALLSDRVTDATRDLELAVRELAPKLLGYCTLETRDAALAEEVSQDALAALVKRWRRLGPPDSPAAFVFAIARRRCARAAVRRRLLLPLELIRERRDGRPDPEQLTIRHAERDRVAQALAGLRRADRSLLLLVTVGDLSLQQAADALEISLSAAKMRAMRARQRLRALLENA